MWTSCHNAHTTCDVLLYSPACLHPTAACRHGGDAVAWVVSMSNGYSGFVGTHTWWKNAPTGDSFAADLTGDGRADAAVFTRWVEVVDMICSRVTASHTLDRSSRVLTSSYSTLVQSRSCPPLSFARCCSCGECDIRTVVFVYQLRTSLVYCG